MYTYYNDTISSSLFGLKPLLPLNTQRHVINPMYISAMGSGTTGKPLRSFVSITAKFFAKL